MIYSLLEDDVGNILIETRDHGVWCYDRKTITDISGLTNFNDESIYSIKRDKPCSFWFATQSKGVWHYDARLSESVGQRKLITKFNTKVGLGNHSVFYIVAEKNGNHWFETRGMGLSRYDGKTFTDFTKHYTLHQ